MRRLQASAAHRARTIRVRTRRLRRILRGLPLDDDELARTVSERVGTSDLEPDVQTLIRHVRPHTKTSVERIAALCAAVDYIVQHDVEGAVVECGVWKGGSMMAAALRLLDQHATDRDLYGYDTFAGMTKPTEFDVSFKGKPELDRWRPQQHASLGTGLHEQDVRTLLESTGWPSQRIRLVVGPVESTLPESAPNQISLLRLDTDWYESTLHELEHLYPRLSVGGVLLLDDYGHYKGARKAVDEYFQGHRIFLHRIDYSGRIGVKQCER